MKLFYESAYHSSEFVENRNKALEAHYNSPMKNVHGAEGLLFEPDDIYLYGKLEQWAENDPKIEAELREFVERYKKQDYGFVSREEAENNLENRWLCGSSSWTIARYYFKDAELTMQYGGIVLEFLRDEGFFYSVEDSIDELRE
ncbi:hypothetical protein SAMN02910339_01377 [Lachnospiraceae bacterium YSD2013]|nr:hypothetical protein SAMN02910339_01377 [Lachnospiraceae bacterium YSD2013]